MIAVNDLEQGSKEWLEARLAIPTASNFGKIFTATGKPSTSAKAYMNKLLAEHLIGALEEMDKTEWMERGNLLEAEARGLYEFETFTTVSEVGIVYKDEARLVSCSPDGLVDDREKGLEIKCPSPAVHVDYLMKGVIPTKYIPQVQGSMWVTGLEEWDFMSYHPEMPSLIVTVQKDAEWHQGFEKVINKFINEMLANRGKLSALTSQQLAA